jgi:hypothetical protein
MAAIISRHTWIIVELICLDGRLLELCFLCRFEIYIDKSKPSNFFSETIELKMNDHLIVFYQSGYFCCNQKSKMAITSQHSKGDNSCEWYRHLRISNGYFMFLHLHIDFIYNATVHINHYKYKLLLSLNYLTRISYLYVFNIDFSCFVFGK